ncbi:MAG: 3-hydroxyacyl-CoA dehydrogenase NAD-binding domain-containing protein, partial [Bdellovibrionota bacterium]
LADRSAEFGPGVWVMTINKTGEKVNKLGRVALDGFKEVLPELEKNKAIEVLCVVSGKPGNFIAGADIDLIRQCTTSQEAESLSRSGQKLLNRWEDLPYPTVAVVDGACLGGGCEMALGCTALVMSNSSSARIGLPEVMLGLIPGMGGCVRLPRKVGLATALDMILTGKQLRGEQAFKLGLADALLPQEEFEAAAIRWARNNANALKAGKRLGKEPKLGGMGGPVGTLMEKTPIGRSVIFKKARSGVLGKTRGQYPAPIEALDVLMETGSLLGSSDRLRGTEREEAMAREAKGFAKLAVSEVSRNLIRIFFLTEKVKKANGLPEGREVAIRAVETGAVIGAGIMGGGIAQLFADKKIPTRMKDLTNQALALGVDSASRIFKRQVKRRKITDREMIQKLGLITPVLDHSGFRQVNLVVEAVVERMDVKQKVLQELEEQVGEKCIVASNTSSLSVTEMQSVLKHPGRFAGMHFFNPVHRMPLVEVIRGEKTDDQTVAGVFQFCKQLGKTPIVVRDAPGFLVNRLLAPYMNEAAYLLAEGVTVDEIDQALVEFGMPMGPMELMDEVGIDVADKVSHIMHAAFGERMAPAPLSAKLVSTSRYGKKNGKGLYLYEGKERKEKKSDPSIYSLLGISPKPGVVTAEEMVDRTVLPMINEAARCLAEGIVAHPDDVDLGMIMGTGFPPFRGGLLRYADSLGSRKVLEKLRKLVGKCGKRFEPSDALVKLGEENRPFHNPK